MVNTVSLKNIQKTNQYAAEVNRGSISWYRTPTPEGRHTVSSSSPARETKTEYRVPGCSLAPVRITRWGPHLKQRNAQTTWDGRDLGTQIYSNYREDVTKAERRKHSTLWRMEGGVADVTCSQSFDELQGEVAEVEIRFSGVGRCGKAWGELAKSREATSKAGTSVC